MSVTKPSVSAITWANTSSMMSGSFSVISNPSGCLIKYSVVRQYDGAKIANELAPPIGVIVESQRYTSISYAVYLNYYTSAGVYVGNVNISSVAFAANSTPVAPSGTSSISVIPTLSTQAKATVSLPSIGTPGAYAFRVMALGNGMLYYTSLTATTTAQTAYISNLSPSVIYSFAVQYVLTGLATWTTYSQTVSATTIAPPAVTGFQVSSPGDIYCTASWTSITNPASGDSLAIFTSAGADFPSTVTSTTSYGTQPVSTSAATATVSSFSPWAGSTGPMYYVGLFLARSFAPTTYYTLASLPVTLVQPSLTVTASGVGTNVSYAISASGGKGTYAYSMYTSSSALPSSLASSAATVSPSTSGTMTLSSYSPALNVGVYYRLLTGTTVYRLASVVAAISPSPPRFSVAFSSTFTTASWYATLPSGSSLGTADQIRVSIVGGPTTGWVTCNAAYVSLGSFSGLVPGQICSYTIESSYYGTSSGAFRMYGPTDLRIEVSDAASSYLTTKVTLPPLTAGARVVIGVDGRAIATITSSSSTQTVVQYVPITGLAPASAHAVYVSELTG